MSSVQQPNAVCEQISNIEDTRNTSAEHIVRVAPHPVRSTAALHIHIQEPSSLTIRLLSVAGVVHRVGTSVHESADDYALPIDVSTLNSGLYFIETTIQTFTSVTSTPTKHVVPMIIAR